MATALLEIVLRKAFSKVGTAIEVPAFSNSGPDVNMFLASVGLPPRNYWCMAFVYWCFQEASKELGIKNPAYKTGGTIYFLEQALNSKIVFSTPQVGDVFIVKYSGSKGHTGLVYQVNGNNFVTIEGNTSPGPGIQRNGGGVYKKTHTLSSKFYFVRFSGATNSQTIDTNNVIEEDGSNKNLGIRDDGMNNSSAPVLDFDFEKIETNISNLEQDDNLKTITWGVRSNYLEDTDWIGLKQYLLYLNTTYYTQVLVPFVELIPIFTQDTPKVTNANNGAFDIAEKIKKDTSLSETEKEKLREKLDALEQGSEETFVDQRFEKTAAKLSQLSKIGGTDLLTTDPFKEMTDAFNVLNDTGKSIKAKRNLSPKLQGMIVFNSKLLGDELSKIGSIGFDSLEIECGSQSQQNMSLVTIKILDVQGNKLLDVNSPWSFILNSRPGMIGADFYFRYGWQVRIPPRSSIGSDLNAKKFWNHPGWYLFGGEERKIELDSMAAKSNNTLTLTQSIASDSFTTPMYVDYAIKDEYSRSKLGADKYVLLTLINPEISVNPQDGSIMATLFFRTNSTVANLLCPLFAADNMVELINGASTATEKDEVKPSNQTNQVKISTDYSSFTRGFRI